MEPIKTFDSLVVIPQAIALSNFKLPSSSWICAIAVSRVCGGRFMYLLISVFERKK